MAEAATIIDLEGKRARMSELRFERGQRCGPYEIVRLIAAGGFGDVYEGVHQLLRRKVAIKILQNRHMNGRELRARLEQEARVLSEIKNPHMVTVFDAGELGGRIWMAMELLEGRTLRELLANGRPLPVARALHHAASVANGVAAAHDLRVVHRDLKPENIFVTSDGHTVVLDLGTAKVLGDVRGKQTQRVIGTVAYMSPEHLLGGADGLPIDQRTDVYSLCLILYEMLAGFHPFARNRDTRQMPSSAELARMQLRSMPEPLPSVAPGVPDYVWRIVHTGISKKRELRHSTMRELEVELRQAARWFVEERAAGERSSQRAGVLSLEADTEPDPIPAFMSANASGAAASRSATERLGSSEAPIDPRALRETRTAPNVALPSPEPPGVTLGASAAGREAGGQGIPRRVILAPVAGALIGLAIVAGMNRTGRRAPAPGAATPAAPPVASGGAVSSAPAATVPTPSSRELAPAPAAVSPPVDAPASTPDTRPDSSATRVPRPAAATTRVARPTTATTRRPTRSTTSIRPGEDAPRPINDDDFVEDPMGSSAPRPKTASSVQESPKAGAALPSSGL